ncbi:MAG: hypothetical protein JWO56_1336 [Acidobacteria bacterium]|nr:hypothetical protein [Acidobacteriota bacterium]
MRLTLTLLALLATLPAAAKTIATFSIVARDPVTHEAGVAVASRFFSVGSVVPWARAGAGAIATQANANVGYGPRGLELLERGLSAEETLKVLLRNDPDAGSRQVGIVANDGSSATYSGPDCNAWAGGRHGPNYAVQGNILTGEPVVVAMEKAFLETSGTLARRMYAALLAGDTAGGDSRGRQSAAMVIVKEGAGYNGGSDRAIDIRVDDHADPFKELGRLLDYAEMNYAWNEGWTAFTRKRYAEALPAQERAALLAPRNPELLYDLAVIRLAAGKRAESLAALTKALELNPKLKKQAAADKDLNALHGDPAFEALVAVNGTP